MPNLAGREGIKPPSTVLETVIIIIIPTTHFESQTGFEPVMNTVLQTVAFDLSATETFYIGSYMGIEPMTTEPQSVMLTATPITPCIFVFLQGFEP